MQVANNQWPQKEWQLKEDYKKLITVWWPLLSKIIGIDGLWKGLKRGGGVGAIGRLKVLLQIVLKSDTS